jgi:hypothetical protein
MKETPYFEIDDGVLVAHVDGIALLRFPLSNKGTAFTVEERIELGLDGLLPPAVNTLQQQVERAYRSLSMAPTPIARYQLLRAMQERHEVLFYAVLAAHLEELLPVVYTPTVGEAVQRFSALYQHPRGLSFSPENIGRSAAVCANYPLGDVRMIVATDSSAILGIGDQGLRRAGHPHRQAGPLHRRRRRLAVPYLAGGARRRHRPRRPGRRSRIPRGAARAAARRGLPRVRRSLRRRGALALAARRAAVGGPGEGHRLRGARALPRGVALVQRRHPGDGRDGARRGAGSLQAARPDAG